MRRKSKAFALRIIRLYQYLCNNKNELVLSKQILRSGTSIGANLAEAEYAISKTDFRAKQFIALKECSETKYWLELLHESGFINDKSYESIMFDCIELLKLLTASVKTLSQELDISSRDKSKESGE